MDFAGREKIQISVAAVMRLLGCAIVVIMVVVVTVLPCCVIVFWTAFAQEETEHPDTN